MSVGRIHGLYRWGKTYLLHGKSRDQRWFHHGYFCVHYVAASVNAYWYSHTTCYSKLSTYWRTLWWDYWPQFNSYSPSEQLQSSSCLWCPWTKAFTTNHCTHKNEHANYDYYKSIGGYTEGADAIFEMHNSACRLIEDHLSVINSRMFNLTCQIATLRENAEGYLCTDPHYWWDMTLTVRNKK